MSKRCLDVLLTSLLLICFSSLAYSAEEEAVKITTGYVSLGKAMVLNLSTNGKRPAFLQLKADVLVNNEDLTDQVNLHVPAIRHQLIVLLSEQKVVDMKTAAKREAVRLQATTQISDMIKQMTGNKSVDEVLFSNFLVQ